VEVAVAVMRVTAQRIQILIIVPMVIPVRMMLYRPLEPETETPSIMMLLPVVLAVNLNQVSNRMVGPHPIHLLPRKVE
jgi:hypothetical protein